MYDTHWILLPLALTNVLWVIHVQHGGAVTKKEGDGNESTHKSGDRIRPVTAKEAGETGDDGAIHVGETGRSRPVKINETGGNEMTDSGTCECTKNNICSVLRNSLTSHCFVLVVCTIELTHVHALFPNSEGG